MRVSIRRIFWILILATILVESAVIAGWVIWPGIRHVVVCTQTFGAITSPLVDGLDEGMPYPDILPERIRDRPMCCSACGGPYVYRPKTPAGDAVCYSKDSKEYIIWCPAPCHFGRRYALGADGSIRSFRDDEVSWFYQKDLTYLTPEQVAQEMQYRITNNIPLPEGAVPTENPIRGEEGSDSAPVPTENPGTPPEI